MNDEGKKGQHAGHGQHGGPRPDLNDALLDVFKELVNRVGEAPQNRPLPAPAAEVLKGFLEFRDALRMTAAIESAKKNDPKQRQQKGA